MLPSATPPEDSAQTAMRPPRPRVSQEKPVQTARSSHWGQLIGKVARLCEHPPGWKSLFVDESIRDIGLAYFDVLLRNTGANTPPS